MIDALALSKRIMSVPNGNRDEHYKVTTMSRLISFRALAIACSVGWGGTVSAQSNSTSYPNPIPTGNAFFNNFYQNLSATNSTNSTNSIPSTSAPGGSWLMKNSGLTSNATSIPDPNDPKNNFSGLYSSLSNSSNPRVVYHTLESLERSARQGDWQRRYDRQFPGAIYNYEGWSQRGSIHNNPLSLYGPAASTPTALLNPNYVTGGPYQFKAVPYKSPNPMAPPRYEYVPIPQPKH
jgi:hypothetical protein